MNNLNCVRAWFTNIVIPSMVLAPAFLAFFSRSVSGGLYTVSNTVMWLLIAPAGTGVASMFGCIPMLVQLIISLASRFVKASRPAESQSNSAASLWAFSTVRL